MKKRCAVALLAVLLICTAGAWAQVSTSRISGTVLDSSKAVVPGAKVTATNEATGVQNFTETNTAGSYVFDGLIVGSYSVTVELTGFKKFVSAKNVLNVGAPIIVDVQMEVGEVTSVVTVESTYERIATSSAMISDVIDRRAIRDLPLNGRNPLNLIILEPGLIQRSTGGRGSGTHINGSRDRAFNVTLDGIDINEPSVPNPQSNTYRLTTDNVQEYRIVTSNATADFGRNSGANIALASRAGTNELHGNIYEYFRNPVLNANDYFNNLLGVEKPNFKTHQFGADVGGPAIKNRTFWFFSWQSTRLQFTQPIQEVFGTPISYSQLARQGIFRYVRGTVTPTGGTGVTQNRPSLVDPSTGAYLPGVEDCITGPSALTNNCIDSYAIGAGANDPLGLGLDPVMGAYINSMPLPNSFTSGDGLNTGAFFWNPPSRQPELRFLIRVDHRFNDNHSIFGRYTWSNSDTKDGDFLNSRPQVFPGFPPLGEVIRRPRNIAVSYRAVLSPRAVNEFTAGLSRFLFDFAFGRANPDFPNVPPFVLPNITEPYNNQSGTARTLNTYQYIDNLTYSMGNHLLRGGFNIRFLQHNDQRSFVGGVNNAPRVNFGSARILNTSVDNPFDLPLPGSGINSTDLGNLRTAVSEMLGLPTSIVQAYYASGLDQYTPSGLYVRGVRYKQYNFYFADEWKVRRNITLNLGVRWEYNAPATEANGLILRPDKPIDGSQGPVTFVPRNTFWDRPNMNAIAPRLSVAWDPFSDGKMVVRAGYAMAFDPVSTFQLVPVLGLVSGSSAQCTVSITADPGSTGTGTAGASSGCTAPANSDSRINQGFPLTLPPPGNLPGTFTTPPTGVRSGLAAVTGAIDPNLQTPTVHDWTLNVQRDLGKSIVVQVGYIGKRGTHLFRAYNKNQLKLEPDFLQSFTIARDNYLACGNPNGTAGCGQPVGLLLQMLTASQLSSSTVTSRLVNNAAGSLAATIDTGSSFSTSYSKTVTATGNPNYFRANSQFSSIFYFDSSSDSFYHALQIHVRRQAPNLSFGAAYTFGKSIDDSSTDPVGATSGGSVGNNSGTVTDIFNFHADRGRSDFDRTHVFTSHVVWDLPFGRGQRWAGNVPKALDYVIGGWTASGITTIQSGEPFSVLSGQFTNGNIRFSRADIVGSAPDTGLFSVTGVAGPVVFPDSVLNIATTPFRLPAPGSNGNQGRNVFDGPGYWNVDLGITKKFTITERINLQFRAEFFNAFNHASFDNPLTSSSGTTSAFSNLSNPVAINSDFARVCCVSVSTPSTTALISVGEAARVIQLAMRLSF